MMAFDLSAALLGFASGVVISTLFFVGLGLGMRLALRSAKPAALLMMSAVIRIAALLGFGWVVVGQGGPWALMGYAAAFLLVRLIAMTIARAGITSGGAQ
jgi:F1F0 ATPase subunit 2